MWRHPWWEGAALLGLVLSSCAQEPAKESIAEPALLLGFEGFAASIPSGWTSAVQNLGTAPVRVSVVTPVKAVLTTEATPSGRGLRFPAQGANGQVNGALVVWDQSGALSPGNEDFSFAARINLDDHSDSRGDNGDNVVQRGRWDSGAQYKLQVDHGVPSCRVQGSDGALVARGNNALVRGEWYSLLCERNDDEVRLTVVGKRPCTSDSVVLRGPTGALDFDTQVPVSLGGKVGADGVALATGADQLNGVVDDVMMRVGGGGQDERWTCQQGSEEAGD